MTTWYTGKLFEIESRLDSLHNRLPLDLPIEKRWQLQDRINRLRDEIRLGQGVSMWSTQDDFMFAGTMSVENQLQELEKEIEQSEWTCPSSPVGETRAEELDPWDNLDLEDEEDGLWLEDDYFESY